MLASEARGEARGELKGLRDALRTIVAARGWTLTPAQTARVAACNDAATLSAWCARTATAASADEVVGA